MPMTAKSGPSFRYTLAAKSPRGGGELLTSSVERPFTRRVIGAFGFVLQVGGTREPVPAKLGPRKRAQTAQADGALIDSRVFAAATELA
jgi:hypothetical protein